MLKPRPVDIIVAVEDEYEELDACVQRVRRHGGDFRLILVDDCSADERVGALLRELAATESPRVVLLRNESKLGFAATANRGIASSRNDVIVLGADTLVTSGWLDKLRRCAASDPRIGTATPLANDAGMGSFPTLGQNSTEEVDAELVNRAAEFAAVPLYPEIPIAGRFCMYIRRHLIRKIGGFEVAHGTDHGEVSEFSARVRAAGYRNVLCDDTFVARPGTRRRAGREQSPATPNSTRSLVANPEGEGAELQRESIGMDELEPICGMVRSQVAVLSHQGKPGVLQVLHGRGGGTEKYVQDLMGATGDAYRHYLLRILPDRWRLIDGNATLPTSYERLRTADGAKEGDWLGSLCAWLRIELVHVHSLVGSGDDLLRLLEETGLPHCYTAHDMYLACPTVYLIDSRGEYCNATTDPTVCRRCLAGFATLSGIDVEEWRHRYRTFLDKSKRVFTPSAWARDTLAKYYPDRKATIAPPGLAMRADGPVGGIADGWHLPNDGYRHVGVLGAIGPEKGARHLEGMAARIRDRNLPLRLIVVGYTDRDQRHQSDDRVLTIHGPYRGDEIAALLDYYRIPVVLFPTIWPETFSYTLSETWLAGRPAIVPPRGALQERVLATGAGWVMDGWPNVDSILDQIMAVTAPENGEILARKAQLARAVFGHGHDAREPMRKFYGDMLADTPGGAEHAISRLQIHEAACRALGIERSGGPADRAPAGLPRDDAGRGRLFRLFRG